MNHPLSEVSAYVPLGHSEHVAHALFVQPSWPKYPVLQPAEFFGHEVLAASAFGSAVFSVQEVEPEVVENMPLGHCVQVANCASLCGPGGPYVPGGQMLPLHTESPIIDH